MPVYNYSKKIEKLNRFVKTSDKDVYEWSFTSRYVLKASYKYIEIVGDVEKIIEKEFGEICEIHFLGSRVMGVGDDDESDLDFFIDIGGKNYYRNRNYDQDVKVIEKLQKILDAKPKQWHHTKINYSVPSLKVMHNDSNIKCDISVTNGMAVHNSKLFATLFELNPEGVALYHYVKRWLRLFDFKLKGFTLANLIVFYMQCKNFLPPIVEVQKGVPKESIDNFEVQFNKDRSLESYNLDEMTYYKHHVRDFFYFYYNYPYNNTVMSTYSGKIFDKLEYSYKIDLKHPFNIAAPLLRRINCSKYLTNLDVANFMEACMISCKYLDEYRPPRSMIYDLYGFEKKWYGP